MSSEYNKHLVQFIQFYLFLNTKFFSVIRCNTNPWWDCSWEFLSKIIQSIDKNLKKEAFTHIKLQWQNTTNIIVAHNFISSYPFHNQPYTFSLLCQFFFFILWSCVIYFGNKYLIIKLLWSKTEILTTQLGSEYQRLPLFQILIKSKIA